MKRSQNSFSITAILFSLFAMFTAEGVNAMAEIPLYTANFETNAGRKININQLGSKISIEIIGFGPRIVLNANRGGTSTCRTIVEHRSERVTVTVSLAIPDPRARCRMLPSFVTIESRDHNLSVDEEPLKKISGNNARVRSAAQKVLGKLDNNEG
jgi:hypothetical protein